MKLFFITITSIFLFSCTSENNIAFVESKKNDLSILVGDFNNFQQFWLENTEDELHREKVNQKHEHIHLKIKSTSVESSFDLEMYTGRKNDQLLGKKTINFAQDSFTTEKGILKSLDGTIKIRGDTLWIDGLGLIPKKNEPYRLVRCRYFSGWIQYPIAEKKDSTYMQGELEIHDQGGIVELNLEGVDFTVELTQLVYAKRIKLMKIAIYDLPLNEVGLNSKSIAYAWTSPEAKRLGINLRKIVSGWTLIEPNFINTNTMNKENE